MTEKYTALPPARMKCAGCRNEFVSNEGWRRYPKYKPPEVVWIPYCEKCRQNYGVAMNNYRRRVKEANEIVEGRHFEGETYDPEIHGEYDYLWGLMF